MRPQREESDTTGKQQIHTGGGESKDHFTDAETPHKENCKISPEIHKENEEQGGEVVFQPSSSPPTPTLVKKTPEIAIPSPASPGRLRLVTSAVSAQVEFYP